MRYNPLSNIHTIFTHDKVYFDGKNEDDIDNKEMKTVYIFATDDGIDEVYASGYLDKINMTYKHIPHGLAYAQKYLGFFT